MDKGYTIYIDCKCNKQYEAKIKPGYTKMGYHTNESRFHQCPSCRHIWDLRPDLPKPTMITINVGVLCKL